MNEKNNQQRTTKTPLSAKSALKSRRAREAIPCVLSATARKTKKSIRPFRLFQLEWSLEKLANLNFLSFIDANMNHVDGTACYFWKDGGFVFLFTYNHHYKMVIDIFDSKEFRDPDDRGPKGPPTPRNGNDGGSNFKEPIKVCTRERVLQQQLMLEISDGALVNVSDCLGVLNRQLIVLLKCVLLGVKLSSIFVSDRIDVFTSFFLTFDLVNGDDSAKLLNDNHDEEYLFDALVRTIEISNHVQDYTFLLLGTEIPFYHNLNFENPENSTSSSQFIDTNAANRYLDEDSHN